MKKSLLTSLHAFLAGLLACMALAAPAAETKLEPVALPEDLPSLERGAETVVTVCAGCHGLKYIKYRDLLNRGIDKDKVEAWRNGQPLDNALQAQMTEDAARAAFSGATPPDLSLIAAAREGGGNYLYAYLTGYHKTGKGDLTNTVFPQTQMPDILAAADAADEKQRAEVETKAKEISAFLVWAADPHAEERKRMGYYVLGYVAFMTLLLFLWKNRIWREIDKQPKIK
jgi:ubiquinol-cytochrome c reductase cytochrome c1 subunit